MIRRLLLGLMLLTASVSAKAGFYTDIWYRLVESGWGVNLVQTDNFIFATFFIYGPDGKPTWYTAHLSWNGVDRYAGKVFANEGTFFGAPWNTANNKHVEAGTGYFKPSATNAHQGTLSYTIPGVGSAEKEVERQSLLAPALGGSYVGVHTGTYTNCTDPTNNTEYTGFHDLTVTHLQSGMATFEFSFNGLLCTMEGTLVQNGQLYRIPSATYTCTEGTNTTASISELKRTSQGLEGRFVAGNAPGGCTESGRFSALLN